jgi:hypothetical protein
MVYNNMPPQKFIILKNGRLVMGRVWLHKDLYPHKDEIIGGGYWHKSDDKFYFYSTSEDFGPVTKEDLTEEILGHLRFANLEVYFSEASVVALAVERNVRIK